MRPVAVIFLFVLSAAWAFGQPLTPQWSTGSFVQPCSEENMYRYVNPAQVFVDSNGDYIWLCRDRSSCRQPWNNFNLLKVKKDGRPDLSFFRKYDTPGDYYADVVTISGNRIYWVGSSYAVDTARSLFIAAMDLSTGDTLWMRQWYPVGKTYYTINGITATDEGVYVSASAFSYINPLQPGYSMMIGKWDTKGMPQWTNTYIQPFNQRFQGNLVVSDSILYACGTRYADMVPYYRGSGFIGAYNTSDGVLVDSFYYSLKRRSSEYIPSVLAIANDQLVAIGTNSSTADPSLFVSSFSKALDSVSFYSQRSTYYYAYLLAATVSKEGLVYMATYTQIDSFYHLSINMANCKNGCYPTHTGILMQPEAQTVAYMTADNGSLLVSTVMDSPDTTLIGFNRRDGYLLKFDVALLGVGRPKGTGITESVSIYPHPVRTHATFTTATELHDGILELRDALGRVVMHYDRLEGSSFTMPRGNLMSGIYFYSITDEQGARGSGKIIIE